MKRFLVLMIILPVAAVFAACGQSGNLTPGDEDMTLSQVYGAVVGALAGEMGTNVRIVVANGGFEQVFIIVGGDLFIGNYIDGEMTYGCWQIANGGFFDKSEWVNSVWDESVVAEVEGLGDIFEWRDMIQPEKYITNLGVYIDILGNKIVVSGNVLTLDVHGSDEMVTIVVGGQTLPIKI